MTWLTNTNNTLISIGILLLRLCTGLILFVAGAGKVFGWFGGWGLKATIESFKQSPITPFWGYVSCFAELICGLLLMIGLLTRPAALALTINMLVAVLVLGTKDFFAGGAAYPFALMISSLVILITGPLYYSIDAALVRGKKKSFNP